MSHLATGLWEVQFRQYQRHLLGSLVPLHLCLAPCQQTPATLTDGHPCCWGWLAGNANWIRERRSWRPTSLQRFDNTLPIFHRFSQFTCMFQWNPKPFFSRMVEHSQWKNSEHFPVNEVGKVRGHFFLFVLQVGWPKKKGTLFFSSFNGDGIKFTENMIWTLVLTSGFVFSQFYMTIMTVVTC